jgi:hypothetical protein
MVALIEAQLTEDQKTETLDALVKAGALDKSLKGVLKAALKKLGEKIADEAGQAIAEEASDYIGSLLDARGSVITTYFGTLFANEGK